MLDLLKPFGAHCLTSFCFTLFTGILRQKDVEQSLIYEEKITLLLRLLAAAGVDVGVDPPSYCHLVSEYLDNDAIRKEVFSTIQVGFHYVLQIQKIKATYFLIDN